MHHNAIFFIFLASNLGFGVHEQLLDVAISLSVNSFQIGLSHIKRDFVCLYCDSVGARALIVGFGEVLTCEFRRVVRGTQFLRLDGCDDGLLAHDEGKLFGAARG